MSHRPITIPDVALRAGVSESPVSRVLSGVETPSPISEETRERVQKAARMLSYRPHTLHFLEMARIVGLAEPKRASFTILLDGTGDGPRMPPLAQPQKCPVVKKEGYHPRGVNSEHIRPDMRGAWSRLAREQADGEPSTEVLVPGV